MSLSRELLPMYGCCARQMSKLRCDVNTHTGFQSGMHTGFKRLSIGEKSEISH